MTVSASNSGAWWLHVTLVSLSISKKETKEMMCMGYYVAESTDLFPKDFIQTYTNVIGDQETQQCLF